MGREGFVGWASQQQSTRKGTGPPAVGVLGWPGGDRGRAGLWGAVAGCARHTGVPGAGRLCLARCTRLGNAVASITPAPLGEHSLTLGYPAAEAERALPRGRYLPSGEGGSGLLCSQSASPPGAAGFSGRHWRCQGRAGWNGWLARGSGR